MRVYKHVGCGGQANKTPAGSEGLGKWKCTKCGRKNVKVEVAQAKPTAVSQGDV